MKLFFSELVWNQSGDFFPQETVKHECLETSCSVKLPKIHLSLEQHHRPANLKRSYCWLFPGTLAHILKIPIL